MKSKNLEERLDAKRKEEKTKQKMQRYWAAYLKYTTQKPSHGA